LEKSTLFSAFDDPRKSATVPCSEPDKSKAHIYILSLRFILLLSFHLNLRLPSEREVEEDGELNEERDDQMK
jgi:hypothetical protein